jgi:hypothetical protein
MRKDTDNELLLHVFKKQKLTPDDELTLYLKEPCVGAHIDILNWWKVYLIKYIVIFINFI